GSGTAGDPDNFFPLGQQFYTTSSGTSHSTPAVAGACALLRQWFINQALPPPSPAMTKAWLINSARYLTGADANDTLPSNNQGMGEVNLGMAFDGVPRIFRDQVSADKFTATGQTRTFTGVVSDPSRPFRVTLAWTDAPGNTTGNAYNNDLDLTVTLGGQTYKGNVFSGAFSVPGGSADPRNNFESVFLPPGVSGTFVVTVTAANINSDGVPNEAPSLDQDFALVVYNAQSVAGPLLVADSFRVLAESCAPTNGAADPGETVTVALALRNLGTANTTNLVATLLPLGGVANPGGPQSYGAVIAGGGAVTQSFTFTVSAACGQTLNATLALSDNGTDRGTVTFSVPLGNLAPVFSQNFDGVTAPALPPGWTTARSGAQALWVTSTAQRDTLPNSAFANDANRVGVSELVSPQIGITTASAQLTFRHYYNTETAWDGGVLEISIGGGAFTDILSAGGTFVTGGYNRTLNSSSNPLSGRQAWSGNSGGFITTTVNLPAAAAGQTVRFKWRCGTDSSIGGTGWYVDSIVVSDLLCCAGSAVTVPVVVADAATLAWESCAPTNGLPDAGETVTLNLALRNVGSAATSNLMATLLATGGVAGPSGPQFYGALATNGTPVSRPFTFTVAAGCGEGLTVTLGLQDGTNALPSVSFPLVVGRLVTAFTQDFDTVSVPLLPAGWSSTASGAQSLWVTTTALSDTAPNAAFSPDPSNVGENQLVSPPVLLPASAA
ncbi:MAG: S8 family serine peptidase, partial [Verrucomicrobiales bacterium]|nr:S8 family serine peptidase [Verrucomicrobiales bacterium]